ncbi:hypothetical protein IWW36_004177 [Coemansia brasiliensis]|uniref:30S ribosomal protein S15 n=1 Tax=Coemansia brasiliensis TaxID=2650707 RepID=A0A9W8IB98_9FUNG|nr:hypothetical protein IWW36_004177 [Coemansia brasiliensis]
MASLVRCAVRTGRTAGERALHTTPKVQGKRLSNRKAELAEQRAAEADAKRQAEERLRKLKDTAFLNSLEHPERLFSTTQITEQDKAISLSATGPVAAKEEKKETVKREARSGKYLSSVDAEEMAMVTEVAPQAVKGDGGIFGSGFLPSPAENGPEVQSDIVRRVVALENSNAKGVVHYNIRRAVETFGRSADDSGSPEVQAAVWTVRINQLEDHLRINRKDHQNRRAYTKLLHKRAKMLKYLKRESLERYYLCLKQLGLTKEMVEGEILQPKRIE